IRGERRTRGSTRGGGPGHPRGRIARGARDRTGSPLRGGARGRTGQGSLLGHPRADAVAGPPRRGGVRGRTPAVSALRQPHGSGGTPVSGVERPPRAEQSVTAAPPVSPTDPAARRFLAEAELRPLGLMPRASNYTFMVELTDGDRTAFGVY